MLITAPGDVDLDVRAGTSAAEVIAAAGLERAWCGPVELDPDHPAGVPPLIHGARLTASPAPPCVPETGLHLRVDEGPDAGHTLALDRPVIVGRGESADLRLDDPAVSAQHALVSATDRVRVRDLGSANGTSAPRLRGLRPGQAFTVGRSRIVLADPSAPTASPTHARAAARAPAPADAGGATRRWGLVAGGLASGVTLAAMTGRWQLAIVGVLPAAAQWLGRGLTRRRAPDEVSAMPTTGAVAVRGEPPAVLGYVRALLVQRGRRPAGDACDEPWTRWLDPAHADDHVVAVPPGGPWPSWCAVRVDVAHDRRVEDHGGGPLTLLPLAIAEAVADLSARRRASLRADESLPRSLRWGDLGHAVAPAGDHAHGPRRLRAAIGATPDGPFILDLDADGPHVLVAGTTGSGKSVALETLVGALAHAHSPRALALALIDFKGGAGLGGCLGLPHVAATLTDLDGALARRALLGLSHELSVRKAALRERGLGSLHEWEQLGAAPPRLLVVIDEYQEIVASHPTFVPDLARIAAQGRSLGLHLVLATQRPAGAVTPEVRANVATTIALRVASESESRDLLGTADASAIPASIPGRAIIARGTDHTEVQIAAASAEPSPRVARVGEPVPPGAPLSRVAISRWRGHGRAAPLWHAPLPARWEAPGGSGSGIPFALVDRPHVRDQQTIEWEPRNGPAVIVGPPRSGRTAALRSVARHGRRLGLTPVWLPDDPRVASRTLAIASQRPDVLLLIDDVDAALTRLSTVDDGAALEDLARRASLRLPTAMAGSPSVPHRLGATTALLAVTVGVDAGGAAAWGVPRPLVDHSGSPVTGRAHVRHSGGWDLGQLASGGAADTAVLVHALPTPHDIADVAAWGVGGDDARRVDAPSGPVCVVGQPGRPRDRVVERLRGAQVETVDMPALVPAGTTTLVLVEPSPRALRQLSPHDWRGLTDAVPVAGRVVMIRDGETAAVQLRLEQEDSA